jgi:hypothetical protein
LQATLRTPRIRLVPLADEHVEYEVELDADPEVMRYLGNGRARTRDEVAALRSHWRKGWAGEGAREQLRHGFEDLGLTRIFAETMAVNTASRATMAAIGMQ